MKGFFDAFARVAGIFATQTVLQQLVWILMCIVIGIFLMVACYIALKHFYNKSGDRCQICGSFGHVAADCMEMEMGMPSNGNGCRCQLCGTFGHLARFCSRVPGSQKMRYFQNLMHQDGCNGALNHSHSTSCCESSCHGHSHRRSSHCHHRRRYRHRHHYSRKCSNCTHGVFLNAYGVAGNPGQTKEGGGGGLKPGHIGFKLKDLV